MIYIHILDIATKFPFFIGLHRRSSTTLKRATGEDNKYLRHPGIRAEFYGAMCLVNGARHREQKEVFGDQGSWKIRRDTF